MSKDCMLTTIDNPYDPFTEFNKWLAYDNSMGYDSCGLVARLTQTSVAFTEERQVEDIEAAIDRFLAIDPLKIYKKVTL